MHNSLLETQHKASPRFNQISYFLFVLMFFSATAYVHRLYSKGRFLLAPSQTRKFAEHVPMGGGLESLVGTSKQGDEEQTLLSKLSVSPDAPRTSGIDLQAHWAAASQDLVPPSATISKASQPSLGTTTAQTMTIVEFIKSLAAKQPTPGGGAAAALGAAAGAGAAAMSAVYTQRKKDIESGAAEDAKRLIAELDIQLLLDTIDQDGIAYAALQRSWTDKTMSPEEKSRIEAHALAVPVSLVTQCHQYISKIRVFLPKCNPNIQSDAKVGIHQLAGAARAAYQTALVNSPPDETKTRLKGLLHEIRVWEDEIL